MQWFRYVQVNATYVPILPVYFWDKQFTMQRIKILLNCLYAKRYASLPNFQMLFNNLQVHPLYKDLLKFFNLIITIQKLFLLPGFF